MNVNRNEDGKYIPTKHPTPELKRLVKQWMSEGVDDTEIAKRLMIDHDVKLYYAVRLIQKTKKLI